MHQAVYIDVRDEDEFQNEHLRGSINLPLKSLETSIDGLLILAESQEIKLICQSGIRSQNALKLIQNKQKGCQVSCVEGGINKWMNKAELIHSSSPKLSIMRQVMIVAGSLVLWFSLSGLLVNALWLWGAVFVGGGLLFAGLSGICLVAQLLNKMPWN